MQTITTTTNIPQSIATTVTLLDPREQRRQELEHQRAEKWLSDRLVRARNEIFSEDVTVSPAIASLLLRRNPENRSINKRRLRDIKSDLEHGHWMFNGETVIISSDGLLNDGQTRLTACRETGIPLRTMIVFGVPRSARATTDQGSARTTAHYLIMSGRSDDNTSLAALGRLMLQFRRAGKMSSDGSLFGPEPTKAEIVGEVIDNEAAFRRSLGFARRESRFLGPKSLIAACHYIFDKIDPNGAAAFLNAAIDGVGLAQGQPVYALRQRLLLEPKMRQPDRFEAIVRAWNATRRGEALTKIQIMGRVPKVAGWKPEY